VGEVPRLRTAEAVDSVGRPDGRETRRPERDTLDDSSRGGGAPAALTRLLQATDPAGEEEAWAAFVAQHSRVMLHTCLTLARDRDAAMDAYAHVLAALREDSCRRLRAYAADSRSRFTTWLVVVTRRLFIDHLRHRYGRPRGESEAGRADRAARRRLEDLVAAEVDPDELATPGVGSADAAVRRSELADALRRSLGELPPADRLLLALRFDDDRPVREIASLLGLPTVFHVYRRLDAALGALRRALARRGVSSPEP
jgi:RNA polymerase sigma factor (sigma-70 family)